MSKAGTPLLDNPALFARPRERRGGWSVESVAGAESQRAAKLLANLISYSIHRRPRTEQARHDRVSSEASEQLGLLRGELVLGKGSLVAECGELCDLLRYVGLCCG